ncbi:hypothetical protein IV79_GL000674 [Pediococcus claussenii]|nr:hypothetical protein IV79_GL000674 [Pediococcus claussenii]
MLLVPTFEFTTVVWLFAVVDVSAEAVPLKMNSAIKLASKTVKTVNNQLAFLGKVISILFSSFVQNY